MKKCTLLFVAVALMAQLPATAQEVVLNLTGMTPHVGQLFEIRIIDKATMEEEDREFIHNTNFTDIAFPTTAVREISSLAGWSIFPNPAREAFRLDISLRESARIKAALYDQRGVLIRPLFEEQLPARESSFDVKGLEQLSPGTYFLVLQSGAGTAVKTVLKH